MGCDPGHTTPPSPARVNANRGRSVHFSEIRDQTHDSDHAQVNDPNRSLDELARKASVGDGAAFDEGPLGEDVIRCFRLLHGGTEPHSR